MDLERRCAVVITGLKKLLGYFEQKREANLGPFFVTKAVGY